MGEGAGVTLGISTTAVGAVGSELGEAGGVSLTGGKGVIEGGGDTTGEEREDLGAEDTSFCADTCEPHAVRSIRLRMTEIFLMIFLTK